MVEHDSPGGNQSDAERQQGSASSLKSQAKEALREVKQTAAQETDRRLTQVASSLDSIVRALHTAADNLEGDGQIRLAEYTRRAATQVHKSTDYLNTEDAPAMMKDLAQMARDNPGTFVGGSFAAGLALGRFLHSSPSAQQSAQQNGGSDGRA